MGKERWQDRAIPYILHGDGAVFTVKDGNTLMTVSMRSLLARRFQSTILPFFSIPKAVRADGDDDCVLIMWKMLAHFLNSAFAGKHLEKDHEGDPWPPGPLRDAAGTDFLCGIVSSSFGVFRETSITCQMNCACPILMD